MTPSRFILCVAFSCLCAARLAAQDITMIDSTWYRPNSQSDHAPKVGGLLRPRYPDEMKAANEPGYVIISGYVDPNGKTGLFTVEGTDVRLQRAVEVEVEIGYWLMTVAKPGWQPEDARVWLALIFNPKSAAAKGPDATPRLLAVAPAMMPERPTPPGSPPVVRMRLSLDAAGTIVQSAPETPLKESSLSAINEALQAWRFAPARRNGAAVAAEIVVSVLCQPPVRPDSEQFVPPRIVHDEPAGSPDLSLSEDQRGESIVEATIDVDGRTRDLLVSRSSNPVFDEYALEAVRQSRYRPALRAGKPESLRVCVPILFNYRHGDDDPYQVRKKPDQSSLPAALLYDVPPKIRGLLVSVYPYALRRDGVTGTARVTLAIDPLGRVIAVRVTEATRPEFGLALTAAAEGFSFDPARKDGKPVPHLMSYAQTFNSQALPDHEGAAMLDREKYSPKRIVGPNKLDAPLRPVSRRAPIFPVNLLGKTARGEALLEVLIDENGHVRLPRIVSATDEAFGYSAVQAVAFWIFEPPTQNGKIAVVRVQIPFEFVSDSPPAATAAPATGSK